MDILKYIKAISFARPSEKPKSTVQPSPTLEKRDDITPIESRLIPMRARVGRPAQVTSLSSHSSIPGPASLLPNSPTKDIIYGSEKLTESIKVYDAMKRNKIYAKDCSYQHLEKILKENTAGFSQEEYLKALLCHDIPDSVRPFNLFFRLMQANCHVSLTIRDIWLDWLSQPTDPVYKSLLSQVIRIKDPSSKKSLLEWSGNTDFPKARNIKYWIEKVLPDETFKNLPEESETASSMTSVPHHQINPRKRRRNHHQIGLRDEQKKRQKKSMPPVTLPAYLPEDYSCSPTHGHQPTKETPELLPQNPENPGSAYILNPLSSRISATDLIKICKRGKKDQRAVLQYFNELTTLGFTSHQIIRIAVRDGGANNLAAVSHHFSQLTKLGFTITQIVQMVSHTGGSLNLKAVCQDFQQFKVLGFTHDHLVRIVAHAGGSNNLQKVKDCFGSLSHLGHEIIVRMAAHIGGSGNLQAFLDESASLRKSGFSQDQIIGMASHIGGSKNLKAVIRHFDTLRQWEFTHDQIAKIASNNGGSKTIETVISYRKELELLKLGPDKIVQMVSHTGGSKNLQSFIASREALIQSGFTPEQIFNLAAWRIGSKNIKAVLDSFTFSQDYGF